MIETVLDSIQSFLIRIFFQNWICMEVLSICIWWVSFSIMSSKQSTLKLFHWNILNLKSPTCHYYIYVEVWIGTFIAAMRLHFGKEKKKLDQEPKWNIWSCAHIYGIAADPIWLSAYFYWFGMATQFQNASHTHIFFWQSKSNAWVETCKCICYTEIEFEFPIKVTERKRNQCPKRSGTPITHT